ncbi:hypothetical protein GUITHDRAFT_119062 [Guillardia theta CCMP2712]|uniref:Zn(2)-C6 fungal-type domain-containing protein n=1 Tax=Guillardia theta (strain CCMP2712) TaxID=905079 RepID=L1IEU3_GUITC|nr:hypothetical protein GUITHDRAFT_119062 [Guillardia theta CCMP2712]EKX34753.1 hypothetical protein GUITHDRAFT_119062 [Guillardia theta CCMP2712]|eukprot:XP_005821733.1 hypothetical protein GUITHDRAFT_119062 [Guillardia theta CCMP2712]
MMIVREDGSASGIKGEESGSAGRDAKQKCDEQQPCSRCVGFGLSHKCVRIRRSQEAGYGGSKRAGIACVVCRSIKTKCDDQRPCSRCVRLGKEAMCVDDEQEAVPAMTRRNARRVRTASEGGGSAREGKAVLEGGTAREGGAERKGGEMQRTRAKGLTTVEWPLNFNTRAIQFDQASLLEERVVKMGWPSFLLSQQCMFGFDARQLMRVFHTLPPYLEIVTRRAFHAIEVIMQFHKAKAAQAPLDGTSDARNASQIKQIFYNAISEVGVARLSIDPVTGRRTEVYVSESLSRMLGLHVEEMISRLGSRELPIMTTEFSYFCYAMLGTLSLTLHPSKPFESFVRVRDLRENQASSCLVAKLLQQQEFDAAGRVIAFNSCIIPVSRREFENAVEHDSSALMAVSKHAIAGRGYDMLIDDMEPDLFASETMEGMQKTLEGEQRLRLLAKDIEEKFLPVVAIAEQILRMQRNANLL